MPSFGDGGVERMLVHLAGGLVREGLEVDFLTAANGQPYLDRLAPDVTRVALSRNSLFGVQPRLVRYLRAARPDFVLCGKDRAGRAALLARRLSGHDFRLVMRAGTTVSERLAHRGAWTRLRDRALIRATCRAAAAVVGNSRGVVDDITTVAGLTPERVHLIRNPVITSDLETLAAQAVEHPWFADDAPPLILAIGGLRRQKGFDTLIEAFARLRARRECRLVILGRGHLEASLMRRAAELGVADDLALPGFDPNPYRYLARASLFVLSSRWEGSPNALTEALALGTPVVATDCPSGPREILDGGHVAPLVPVGDAPAMAEAMDRVLATPGDPAMRRAAAADYRVELCASRYRALFESLLERPR